jgi:osmoprotectant transport system ATP-binding protein
VSEVSMATQSVEFANVSFSVAGGRRLLSDVSLSVAAGTTTALLGRSGSGKTTLLRSVNALVRPTSGRVLVGGRDVAEQDVIALRRGIGYVIQESGLFPHMTIWQNVRLPLEINWQFAGHYDEADWVVEQALARVGLSKDDFGTRHPYELSGGQRQRAGLARALVVKPSILLMDEPFGALDPLTRAEMQTMLKDLLSETKTTTLIVTHDLEEALYLADRVVLLEAGCVVADLAAGDVRGSGNEAVRAYVAATHREVSA